MNLRTLTAAVALALSLAAPAAIAQQWNRLPAGGMYRMPGWHHGVYPSVGGYIGSSMATPPTQYAAAQGMVWWCDTWTTYYPYVLTCPVPWRASTLPPPPPPSVEPTTVTTIRPKPTSPYTKAPSRSAQTPAGSEMFAQGLRDRTAWEDWFNGLSGDEQAGASFWAAERSRPNRGDCLGTAAFVQGCQEAKARLADADLLRKTEPQYRAGWNSYIQPAPPPPATTTAAESRAVVQAAPVAPPSPPPSPPAAAQIPASNVTPLYISPPTPSTRTAPNIGGASPMLCVYWLNNNKARLNDPAGPGAGDPVVQVIGPSATTGSFGASNIRCRLTMVHASTVQETGWLSLYPLQWIPDSGSFIPKPTSDDKLNPTQSVKTINNEPAAPATTWFDHLVNAAQRDVNRIPTGD
jgi:hypothetical protein